MELARMVRDAASIFSLLPKLGWLVLAGILPCSVAVHAQEFSADIVVMQDNGAAVPAGKLYVSGDKVRIETPAHADGFFVTDGAVPSAYFVRPPARQFMDAGQSSPLTRIFVPVEPDNPCPQWEAMARLAGIADHGTWHCERIGREMIDGINVDTYRATSASGRTLLGWVDPLRKFPLRIKTEDGALYEIGNLRDGPQSAALFQIPASFQKLDPQALIDRIKQSDVWVENRARRAPP
jgi:hypothetical protein